MIELEDKNIERAKSTAKVFVTAVVGYRGEYSVNYTFPEEVSEDELDAFAEKIPKDSLLAFDCFKDESAFPKAGRTCTVFKEQRRINFSHGSKIEGSDGSIKNLDLALFREPTPEPESEYEYEASSQLLEGKREEQPVEFKAFTNELDSTYTRFFLKLKHIQDVNRKTWLRILAVGIFSPIVAVFLIRRAIDIYRSIAGPPTLPTLFLVTGIGMTFFFFSLFYFRAAIGNFFFPPLPGDKTGLQQAGGIVSPGVALTVPNTDFSPAVLSPITPVQASQPSPSEAEYQPFSPD